MKEELQTLAKKAVYGPFGPEDSKNASHLIGEPILWANTELALGSYGVLLSISSERMPYVIQCGRSLKGETYRVNCRWIVFDESGAVR